VSDLESEPLPEGYTATLGELTTAIRTARVQAARAVNTELVALYWRIGRIILERQQQQGWGTKVIDRLAVDLRTEFPGMRGLSARSLVYMRTLAAADRRPIAQQPAAQLPWGHVMTLLDRFRDDPAARDWYAERSVTHGWSRTVLTHHLSTDLRGRTGQAPNTFTTTLPAGDSDLARELLQDPYVLDFLHLSPGHGERELEDALVARLTRFLSELGSGFAFVGRQYRLHVGDGDYYIDLLFFHLRLRRYVVFELKTTRAEPEHLGKLHFYVNVVDDQLRDLDHGDGETIGILLATSRNEVAVEYTLRGLGTPLAVSTYRALPDDVRPALPSPEQLSNALQGMDRADTADDPEAN
jgi:predicted nuclease of restriction endonuclease-like (RecB) superfamily